MRMSLIYKYANSYIREFVYSHHLRICVRLYHKPQIFQNIF